MELSSNIGFGGGCHWCTEAVFQILTGVEKVEQGWIASTTDNASFSEAVIVQYNPKIIPLEVLIEIHLRTHQSTKLHSMRKKYRSAIYTFEESQYNQINLVISKLQSTFKDKIITKAMPFSAFKPSDEEFQDYYQKNPKKPFCEKYIDPKLTMIMTRFSCYTKSGKLNYHANIS